MTDTRNTQTVPPGRSLRRSREDKILAGVAGGLGQHLGINAWWFRWAFIFLALAGGAGVLLYIVAWIFIPEPGEDETSVSRWLSTLDFSDVGTVIGVALIGAAALIVAANVFDISGAFIAAGVLFAIGFILYRGGIDFGAKGDPPPRSPSGHPDDDIETTTVDEDTPLTEEVGGVPTSAAAATVSTKTISQPASTEPRLPRPKKEKSILGRLTLAIVLIVVSLMALLDVSGVSIGNVGAGEWFDPIHYAAVALGIVGVGLILGAWIGKSPMLIVVGILILPMLFITAVWPRSFPWTAGEIAVRPLTASQVDSPYELGAGEMIIDLTALTVDELAAVGSVEMTLGAGRLEIRVPADVGVALGARVGMGTFEPLKYERGGIGVHEALEIGPGPIVLHIDAEVGAGTIVVRNSDQLPWTDTTFEEEDVVTGGVTP
ncbi:MAG: PspC domain-containing protein [Acidimicrobiia bacterium]|nr:PspC domain-containing protein [Acidimicrobiia bacterium]